MTCIHECIGSVWEYISIIASSPPQMHWNSHRISWEIEAFSNTISNPLTMKTQCKSIWRRAAMEVILKLVILKFRKLLCTRQELSHTCRRFLLQIWETSCWHNREGSWYCKRQSTLLSVIVWYTRELLQCEARGFTRLTMTLRSLTELKASVCENNVCKEMEFPSEFCVKSILSWFRRFRFVFRGSACFSKLPPPRYLQKIWLEKNQEDILWAKLNAVEVWRCYDWGVIIEVLWFIPRYLGVIWMSREMTRLHHSFDSRQMKASKQQGVDARHKQTSRCTSHFVGVGV